MDLSTKVFDSIQHASWIRRMFEQGLELKKQFGEDKVYDFSIGNPDLEPPEHFLAELDAFVTSRHPKSHGYMPNAGYPHVREAVAQHLSRIHHAPVTGNDVIMTNGAAGAINVFLKTILNPGEEVLVLSPFFPEYQFYIANHQGKMVLVETHPDFSINFDALEAAITPRTKALLLNSPNNPTGRVYPRSSLKQVADLLTHASKQIGHSIFLIVDEPYREICFDGVEVPAIMDLYPETAVTYSYSKSLGISGQRIGYLAVNPHSQHRVKLLEGATFCNRILGFINAPALMQWVIAKVVDDPIDCSIYQRRRDIFYSALIEMGYEVTKPEGSFYLFPRTPTDDDSEFVQAMMKRHVLVTPGRGFGRAGHFRISCTTSEEKIRGSFPAFQDVLKGYKQ